MNETDENLMHSWAVTMWSGVFQGRGQDDAALLLEEVEYTLDSPTPDELEAELIDQQLLTYCKKALDKRRTGADKETG